METLSLLLSNIMLLFLARYGMNFETGDTSNSNNSASDFEELRDSQDEEEESDSRYSSAEIPPKRTPTALASKKYKSSKRNKDESRKIKYQIYSQILQLVVFPCQRTPAVKTNTSFFSSSRPLILSMMHGTEPWTCTSVPPTRQT